jgi:hypothetical protein
MNTGRRDEIIEEYLGIPARSDFQAGCPLIPAEELAINIGVGCFNEPSKSPKLYQSVPV